MQFDNIPGKTELKQHLTKSVRDHRLGHALLFYGPEGNGALALARAFVQYNICNNPEEETACGHCTNCKQIEHGNFPDLHFIYPVAKTSNSKDKPISKNFIKQWQEFSDQKPFASLTDWLEHIQVENKQAQIGVDESSEILHTANLKPYSGGYKFLVIWYPERMHNSASNKLLKVLEEPPVKTHFLLVSHNPDSLLDTIKSRCYKIFVPGFSDTEISNFLINKGIEKEQAQSIAQFAEGDLNDALKVADDSNRLKTYAESFKIWTRACFQAKTAAIFEWVDAQSKLEREHLKECLHNFLKTIYISFNFDWQEEERNPVLYESVKFDLRKFSPFITTNNAPDIARLLEEAIYDISRNVSSKVVLGDISLKLSRLLRRS